jgi:hypothetical protein
MLSVHILILLLVDLEIWIKRCDKGKKHSGEYRFGIFAKRIFLVLKPSVKSKRKCQITTYR